MKYYVHRRPRLSQQRTKLAVSFTMLRLLADYIDLDSLFFKQTSLTELVKKRLRPNITVLYYRFLSLSLAPSLFLHEGRIKMLVSVMNIHDFF